MKVRAKTVVFVGNALRQEGDIFDYEGPENRHLESLEPASEVTPDPVVEVAHKPPEEAPAKWRPKKYRDIGAN